MPDRSASRGYQLLLAVSVAIPLALYGAVSWYLHGERLREGARDATQTVMLLEEHAQRVFESQRLIIERVDEHLTGLTWPEIRASESVHAFLKGLAATTPHVDGLWLIPPDGQTANSADFFPFPPVDTSDRDYFRALEAADTLFFGEMIVGKLKGNLNFNLSRRRSPTERFNGLILVTASLDYFSAFWGEATAYERPVMSLLRADGEILARFPDNANLPRRLPPDRMALLDGTDRGLWRGASLSDGVERLIAWSRVGDHPLFVAFGVEVDEVLAPWRRDLVYHGIVALIASALLGATASMALTRGHRLALAMTSWRNTAERLRAEVERRVRAEDVAAEKERLLAQVRAATEERRAILDTMAEGVIAFDASGAVIFWNAASQRILGLREDIPPDLDALAAAHRLREADDTPLAEDAAPVARVLAGQVLPPRDLRLLPRGDHGEARVCRFSGAPLRREDGTLSGGVLTFGDVTEERLAEERRALLTAELDHRVRNMLATITAMVRLSASHAESLEDLVATLGGRVAAMARAHGLLTQGGWSGAWLRQILVDEIEPYAADGRVALDGEADILLPPRDALDFALVIHELATNAAKYGAWSADGGRVHVAWQVAPEDDHVVVTWRETGGPPVAPPRRQGFGTTLVASAFAGEPGCGVDLRLDSDGAVCVIRLPLRTAAETAPTSGTLAPGPRPDADHPLAGRRILLVEDEPVVRLELAAALAQAGATVVGPAGSLDEATRLAMESRLDAALLDVNLNGQVAAPLAQRLRDQGVRVVFLTGYGSLDLLPAELRDLPHLQKPVETAEVAALVAGLTDAEPLAD